MSTTVGYSIAGKDAAAKEREDRLLAAKKKLKLYRARTSQRISNASESISSPAAAASPRKLDAHPRRPGSMSSKADLVGGQHQHRRSLSKTGFLAGDGLKAGQHARRMSRSRLSRGGSISTFAAVGPSQATSSGGGGHGHTRSRASISISMSGPVAAPLGVTAAPDQQQLSSLPLRATSPLPPPQPVTAPLKHGRHGSRHTRRSSVSNFRESLEIVSGANGPLPASLHATVSSFSAPAAATTTGAGAISPPSRSPLPAPPPPPPSQAAPMTGWSNDPRQVLEALKERGRIEDEGRSPLQTRQSALEALEGRFVSSAAPSPVVISLGHEAPGQLLAQPSPPATTGGVVGSPLPPQTFTSSPMIGLGMGGLGSKRNSWGTGPLSAVAGGGGGGAAVVSGLGGQGAMELGGIVEEDEEDEDERGATTPVSSPKRGPTTTTASSSSPRKNPSPRRSVIRPLSLSLSSALSPSQGPPPSSPFGLRVSPVVDERTAHSPLGEKRHISVFHSVAASQLASSSACSPVPSTSTSTTTTQHAPPPPPPPARGGLRSLSIGTGAAAAATTTTASLLDRRFPSRPASVSHYSSSFVGNKRSSIPYRTEQPQQRPSTPTSSSSPSSSSRRAAAPPPPLSPTVSTSTYSSFPFGVTGGFGDLQLDDGDEDEDEDDRDAQQPLEQPCRESAEIVRLEAEVSALRVELAQVDERSRAAHSFELAEVERRAADEAGSMRVRIDELERLLDDERNARRLELEGLERAASFAKDAITDLTDERDSLRDDCEGWRQRCNRLERQVAKDRDDDKLAEAQAKLIGEMRDQIYTLVAALERERGEHAETRKEVERVLEDRVRELAHAQQHEEPVAAAASAPPPPTTTTIASQQPQRSDSVALDMGMMYEEEEEDEDDEDDRSSLGHYHASKTTSDASMLSGGSSSFSRHSFSGNTTEDTSIGTDFEDSFSSHHHGGKAGGAGSSFGSSAPNSVRGRDSDVVAALGQLDTLAEEDEEDDDAAAAAAQQQIDDRVRLDSAGSQLSSSTTSDVMPRTPDKTSSEHNRSHSFIRHWSFPKGSICSSRVSYDDEDSSFFGYNKHDSLPPLPISENILPPFLTASLDVDEDTFAFFPPQPRHHESHGSTSSQQQHARRPSSPRPLDRMHPNAARRLSGQLHAMKAPPVAPSALVTVALSHQAPPPAPAPASPAARAQRGSNGASYNNYASSVSSSVSSNNKSLSRLSFGALIGSLGGWSPANAADRGGALPPVGGVDSTLPAPATAKQQQYGGGLVVNDSVHHPVAVLEEEEEEEEDEDEDEDEEEGQEEDVYITTTTSHGTPRQLQHQNQRPMRYITPHEVARPVATTRIGLLDFVGSACCHDRPVFVV